MNTVMQWLFFFTTVASCKVILTELAVMLCKGVMMTTNERMFLSNHDITTEAEL